MDVRNYWQMPPQEQTLLLKKVDREEFMFQYEHKYTCGCEWVDADKCFKERKAYKDKTLTRRERKERYCLCSCHDEDFNP